MNGGPRLKGRVQGSGIWISVMEVETRPDIHELTSELSSNGFEFLRTPTKQDWYLAAPFISATADRLAAIG